MSRVAVVGLGAMGSRIAARLLDAGNELLVWNRSADKAARLVERGAELAVNPAEAAAGAEALLVMVSDPPALAAVTEGPDGVAAGAARSVTVIQMSTVDPGAVRRLASALPRGVGLLDAPVQGSIDAVEAGSLTLFVGGREPLVQRWTPLLSTLGSPIHVGPVGTGTAAKLVANATLFAMLGVLGEAIALADGLGVPREAAWRILSTTPVAAQAERRRDAIENDAYPRRFGLALARKDAELIAAAAAEAGADLPLTTATAEWLRAADDGGLGDVDYTALLKWILEKRRRPAVAAMAPPPCSARRGADRSGGPERSGGGDDHPD
jgi:3-hydroxyisobutyrate dehydrogenase-like beta-hydroxyacid dehydrogenase